MPPKKPPNHNRRGVITVHPQMTYPPSASLAAQSSSGYRAVICRLGFHLAFPYLPESTSSSWDRTRFKVYAVWSKNMVPRHIENPLRCVIETDPLYGRPMLTFYRGRHKVRPLNIYSTSTGWNLILYRFLQRVGWPSCYLYAVPTNP